MERCSISIKGVKQGQFKGELPNLKQRDDWMAALRFSMALSVPHNELTGVATGRRKHMPIKITKEWGAASPQILQALAAAEVLNPVILEFTRTNPNGEEMVFQRVTLTNAIVSDVARSHDTGATGAIPVRASITSIWRKYHLHSKRLRWKTSWGRQALSTIGWRLTDLERYGIEAQRRPRARQP